jgi:hypothetical protein
MTYQQYFLKEAEEDLIRDIALVNAAKAAGFTLTDEAKEEVQFIISDTKSMVKNYGYDYSEYLKLTMDNSMSSSAYERCLTRALLAYFYLETYNSSLSYDDAALTSYYQKNKNDFDTYEYAYLSYSADGNTPSRKALSMERQKKKAQAALADIQAGENLEDVFDKSCTDDYSISEAGTADDLPEYYADWLKDSSRKQGDAIIIERDDGTSHIYDVLIFKNRFLNNSSTVDIRIIFIRAETPENTPSTEATDEAMQAAHDKAQALLNQWETGDKTADSFGKLAYENSYDTYSSEEGGLYENICNGQMDDAFNTWIMDPSRKPGDTTLIESTLNGQYGWFVVYFQSQDKPFWTETVKQTLQAEDTTNWVNSMVQKLSVSRSEQYYDLVGQTTLTN